MDIALESKKTATRIIEWCFLKDREGLDENLPTKAIEELLEKHKQEVVNDVCVYLKSHIDPQLVIYHDNFLVQP